MYQTLNYQPASTQFVEFDDATTNFVAPTNQKIQREKHYWLVLQIPHVTFETNFDLSIQQSVLTCIKL